MYFADYHCHSSASPDATGTLEQFLLAARANGLKEIAITDHYDINTTGCDPNFSYIDTIHTENMEYAKHYQGNVILRMGIEIGQAFSNQEVSNKVIHRYDYDVILSSFHNIENGRDFYFYDYKSVDLPILFHEYLNQFEKNLEFDDFDICTHLTYPHRYIAAVNVHFDLREYKSRFQEILKRIIDMNKTLEFNTSCIRKGLAFTMPDYYVAKLYFDLGGRLISIGSDSHAPKDVGADIQNVGSVLKEIGFQKIATFKKRKCILQSL